MIDTVTTALRPLIELQRGWNVFQYYLHDLAPGQARKLLESAQRRRAYLDEIITTLDQTANRADARPTTSTVVPLFPSNDEVEVEHG